MTRLDPYSSTALSAQKTLAWARYLFWADLSYRNFFGYGPDSPPLDEWQHWWHSFAFLSLWYASEYVVIEGWRDASLQDPVIDDALARWSDTVELLRRYRNGVFHYQPNLVEPKFLSVLRESEQAMSLVYYLHTEFLRFYWSYVNGFPGTPDQRAEFRNGVLAIVGWIPEDVIEARSADLQQLADHAATLVEESTGVEASELREAAEMARVTAIRQLTLYRQQCRTFLSKLESLTEIP